MYRPVALLVALVGTVAAVEPFDIVEWEELKLRPNANFVYDEDRLIFHPQARLTTGYDSNFAQKPDAEGQAYLAVAMGMTSSWLPYEDQRFTAVGIVEGSVPSNMTPGGLPLLGSLLWEDQGEPWFQRGEVRIWRNDSPSLVQTGRQVFRQALTWSYDGTYVSDFMSFGGGPLVKREQYLEDSREFTGTELDNEQFGAQLHWGWQRAETSSVEATVSANAIQFDDHEQLYPDGRVARGKGIWTFPIGDQTTLTTALGAANWNFTAPWAHSELRDDAHELIPEANLGFHWDWEEDSFVEGHASQDSIQGVNANVDTVIDVGAFGRLAILHTRGVDLELGWTRVTASSGPAGQEPERRWGYRAASGVELYYAKGWLWRLAINYTDSRARYADPYTRTISLLQVTVAY